MCGIVGYLGPQSPKNIIVSGLKELEYRGYDSAGIAVLHKGHFKRIRASGKLSNLEEKLVNQEFDGHIGIGHTRWATHGRPTEQNAHPHSVDGISIVHNGIIENYLNIREELLNEGAKIESETDSELIAHLLAKSLKEFNITDKDRLLKASIKVLSKLHGAFSVLAVSEEHPDEMIAFKNGPPLIVGVGEKELVVASDVQAIVSYTKNIIYLDDNEIAYLKGNQCKVFSKDGKLIDKEIVTISWDQEKAQKQGYRHFMLKEIFEQPRAVASAIEPFILHNPLSLDFSKLTFGSEQISCEQVFKDIERIFIVACGTSFYAGMVGEYLIEKMARIPVEVEYASEFRYREPVLGKNSLVIVISQSGETADTLAALRLSKQLGVRTMSICNVARSSIDREADAKVYMRSGVEIGVASTKAFTSTIAFLNVLSIYLSKVRGLLSTEQEQKFLKDLLSLPSYMEKVLAYDKFFNEASHSFKKAKGFLYLGRGPSFPIALEGALKLKELAYMHAEGYAAGEMKHGPIALIDTNMMVVVVAPSDDVYEKTLSNLEEVRARGGQIIAIGSGTNEKLKNLSHHYLALPEAEWTLNPILSVVPLQLLAYHLADALGHDVDQPRNLAKSVTVE